MPPQWFCNLAGSEIGPLAPSQVKQLAAEGRLRKDDFVRKGTEGPWVRAEQVKGLFDTPPVAPPPVQSSGDPPTLPSVHPSRSQATPAPGTPARPIPVETNQPGKPPSSSPPSIGVAQWRLQRERAKKRRRAYLLLGGFVLIVGVGLFIVFRPPTTATGGDVPKKQSELQAEKKPLDSELELDLTEQPVKKSRPESDAESDEARAKEPGTPDSATSTNPHNSEDATTIDASSKKPAVLGGVRITVDSVRLGSPKVKKANGVLAHPMNSYLIVNLALLNPDDSKRLEYSGWSNFQSVSLVDDLGNEYRQWRYPGASIVGQVDKSELSSDELLTDVLVFQRPVPKANLLSLTLPGIAFGKPGSVTFTIPITMIEELTTDSDSPTASEATSKTARGAGPAAKRPPEEEPFDPDKDPKGDISKITRDIEALGGGDSEDEPTGAVGEEEDRKAAENPDE